MSLKANSTINDLQRVLQQGLVKTSYWKCCLNCEHWGDNSCERQEMKIQKCHKFNVVPPPDVLVHACEHWMVIVPF
jgi:hypothetical protein